MKNPRLISSPTWLVLFCTCAFLLVLGLLFGNSWSWADPGDEDLVPWPFEFQCPIIWEHLEGTWIIRDSSHAEMPIDHFKIEITMVSSLEAGQEYYRFVITRYSWAHKKLSVWEGRARAGSREWKAFLVDEMTPPDPGQNRRDDEFAPGEYFNVIIRVFEEKLKTAHSCEVKDLVTVISLKRVASGSKGETTHHYLLEKLITDKE